MAIKPDVHDRITRAQDAAGLHSEATLKGQTALQNIRANAEILKNEMIRTGMPEREAKRRVKAMEEEALAFAKKHGIKTC